MTNWTELALAWARGDCDPETARQAVELATRGDEQELIAHFGGALVFGTAGLRAEVGPGPLRMNRAVVRQATHAVAQHLKAGSAARAPEQPASSAPLRVVVGYDARLTSSALAREAVGVLAAAGVQVRYFSQPVATPLVAYALRALGADAAIVITASHNPPQYNGYKLYAANGAQIIPPADADIAARLARAPAATSIACAEQAFDAGHALASPVPEAISDAYYERVAQWVSPRPAKRDLSIVYTPLHGVGLQPVMRVLERAGHTNVEAVAEQAAPDGRFPTVPFPNPEEPGALDRALALARRRGAALVIANDPDVDRLAACARDRQGALLGLTGNQLGMLLADYCLRRYQGGRIPLVVQSIVSSPALESIAQHYGARCERTLTGFKWIWNAALALQQERDLEFVFGYEEALGFSAGDVVRDKDGIAAALLFCELAAELAAQGSGVIEHLEQLYRSHGLWVSLQRSVRHEGPQGAQAMQAAVQRLVAQPPVRLAGELVTAVTDYRSGEERRPAWLMNSPLVELQLGAAGRVLVRPSGTEPKLKVYVDLRQAFPEDDGVAVAQQQALERARLMAEQLLAASAG